MNEMINNLREENEQLKRALKKAEAGRDAIMRLITPVSNCTCECNCKRTVVWGPGGGVFSLKERLEQLRKELGNV